MTFFGHFNFWLLFWNFKLICPGIRKKHETYVVGGGGGVQRISIFFWKQPQAYDMYKQLMSSKDAELISYWPEL